MREVEIQLRLFDLGLGGLHRGVGRQVRLDVVVQLTLSDRSLFRQRSIPIDVELGLAELRLRLRELCLGLIKHGLKRTRIDLEKDLPLADRRTFFIVLRDEVSGYLRLDLRVVVPVQRRHPFLIDRNVLLDDADDVHLRRLGVAKQPCRLWQAASTMETE